MAPAFGGADIVILFESVRKIYQPQYIFLVITTDVTLPTYSLFVIGKSKSGKEQLLSSPFVRVLSCITYFNSFVS